MNAACPKCHGSGWLVRHYYVCDCRERTSAESAEGARWRDEVLDPATMTTADIRAELRHDLDVHARVQHPFSKAAMAHRITVLVEELDRRVEVSAPRSGADQKDNRV